MYNNPSRNSWNVLVSYVSGLMPKLSNTSTVNCGIRYVLNKLCIFFNIRRRRKMKGNRYVAKDNMIISLINSLFHEYYYGSCHRNKSHYVWIRFTLEKYDVY